MQVKRYNITNPKKYEKNGEEKTAWQNVGYITLFHKEDGTVSGICEIPALNAEFKVFEQKDRDDRPNFPKSHTSEDVNSDVAVDDMNW